MWDAASVSKGGLSKGGGGVAYVANITYLHENIPELLMAAGFIVYFYKSIHRFIHE